jgi:hypothetical protein
VPEYVPECWTEAQRLAFPGRARLIKGVLSQADLVALDALYARVKAEALDQAAAAGAKYSELSFTLPRLSVHFSR